MRLNLQGSEKTFDLSTHGQGDALRADSMLLISLCPANP
jgi:hypothetical protein